MSQLILPVVDGLLFALIPSMRSLRDFSGAGRHPTIAGAGLKMLSPEEKSSLLSPYYMSRRVHDIMGYRFGRLLVLFYVGMIANKKSGWLCRCDCGSLLVCPSFSLLNGRVTSCGCSRIDRIIGSRHGKLTVLRKLPREPKKKSSFECLCDCGNTVAVSRWRLARKTAKHCGCVKKTIQEGRIDITGMVSGRLTALRIDKERTEASGGAKKRSGTYWMCSCSCGNETSVLVSKITGRLTKSCGCLKYKGGGRISLPDNAAKKNSLFNSYRKSARERNHTFDLSRTEFLVLTTTDCTYCGAEPTQSTGQNEKGLPFYYNGIDRVDNSLGYTSDNSVPCCRRCNFAKHTMSKDNFLAHSLRIVEHNNLQKPGAKDE